MNTHSRGQLGDRDTVRGTYLLKSIQEPSTEQKQRAVRRILGSAQSPHDGAILLEALGLSETARQMGE